LKITTKDGADYSGTAQQIVCFLWKNAFLEESTVDTYMKAVQDRCVAVGDEPPRSDTAQHFLEDLMALKIITIDQEVT